MPPRVFQGGSGRATPPQVSFERLFESQKGDDENLSGGGPCVTVRVELFGAQMGRVGVGRYLILSHLSDPNGSADLSSK